MKVSSKRRALSAWLALLLGLSAALLGAKPQQAAANQPPAECMASGGIYIYILYEGSLVAQGCSTAGTGYARINQVASAEQTGGFVCRIAGLPDKCVAPHAGMDVYWTYWWWRNGAWQYASSGAGYAGVPGTAEAWNYSAGQAPGFNPPPPRAAEPAPPVQPQQPEQPQQPQKPEQPQQPAQPQQPQQPAQPQQPQQPQQQPQQPQPQPADQGQPSNPQATQPTENTAQPTEPAASDSAQPGESPTATPESSDSPSASTSSEQSPSNSSSPDETPTHTPRAYEEGRPGGSPWPTVGVFATLLGAAGGYLLWRRRQ